MVLSTFHPPPVAHPRQRHRIVRGDKPWVHNYTPTKAPVNAFKAAAQTAFAAAHDAAPFDGPVWMEVLLLFPRPQSMMWKKRKMPRTWHAKKPDLDNVVKSLKDALSGLAWRDDSQVCMLVVKKQVAAGHEQPSVDVWIGSVPTVSIKE